MADRIDSLLPAERLSLIRQEIDSKGVGVISELSGRFRVSEMTIRRDLDLLEAQGVVLRTRGGAIGAIRRSGAEPLFAAKRTVNMGKKAAIAMSAAQRFVADGDIIIMEGGTTVTAMARHLSEMHVTVVTNGIFTAAELARCLSSGSTVVATGGIIRDASYMMVGPVVERFFDRFHADTVFLSATGFVNGVGFMDPDMLETEAKRAMLRAAERAVLLFDSTKFGVKSLMTVLQCDELDAVITDEAISPETIEVLRNEGTEVFVVQ